MYEDSVAAENLQTIIVSKKRASTRKKAEKLAKPHARRLYTSRETGSSWRFRQRPPSDFVKGSFKSFPLPQDPCIILVYGKLKRTPNPSAQRWLQYRGGEDLDVVMREWDYWMAFSTKVKRVRTAKGLRAAIRDAEKRQLQTPLIRGMIVEAVADQARARKISQMRKSVEADERLYRLLKEGRIGNPTKNPARKKNKSTAVTAKRSSAKAPKAIKLKSPKTMPDPGPCAWLGSMVEWGWVMAPGQKAKKLDNKGNAIWEPNSEWMFMWSPKYKAVVAVKRPRNMYRLAGVSRHGGAAKMFETFMARPAECTFDLNIPDVPLHEMGVRASHIVYRSNKWSPTRKNSDYIHDFKKKCEATGCRSKYVKLYCGPTIQRPEVFLCFGGKLTLTKRGLVW